MWHQVLIISITCIKLGLIFRAIVHAIRPSVILVEVARHLSHSWIFPLDFPRNRNWPSSVKTSVRISIVMIVMHTLVKPGYYSPAILVITLGFSESWGKIALKHRSTALNSTLNMQDVSFRTWYQDYSSPWLRSYPVYLMAEPAYLTCHAIVPASSAWIVGGALGTGGRVLEKPLSDSAACA